jgi:hypothetical protein
MFTFLLDSDFREEIFYWWVDAEISILLKTFSQVKFVHIHQWLEFMG